MYWQSSDSVFLVVYSLTYPLVNTLMESIKEHLRIFFQYFHFYSEINRRIVFTNVFATKFISTSRYFKSSVTFPINNACVQFCVLFIAIYYLKQFTFLIPSNCPSSSDLAGHICFAPSNLSTGNLKHTC